MWNGSECAKMGTSRQSSPTQIMIDQIQPECVEYLEYFGSIRNYAREIKYSIDIKKQLSTKRNFSPTNSS